MIVSANDERRSALQNGARDSQLFAATRVMADGRFALEHLWDCMHDAKKAVPDVIFADISMSGLSATQLVREIRQYQPIRDVFVAVCAPAAGPRELDELESAGTDFVIRAADPLVGVPRLMRNIVYRCSAKADPVHLNATKLSCGSLSGCGLDVPTIS